MRSLFVDHPVAFDVARASECYRAYIRRVVDGDTVEVLADLGLYQFTYCSLRLKDIYAPEIVGLAAAEGKRWQVALELLLSVETRRDVLGWPVIVRTERGDRKSFERFVATLFTPDDRDIGALLCAAMQVEYPMLKQ